jgi:hypothetical protein
MDTLTIVLLVVIALISIVQTVFLVRLWREGVRTTRGLDRLADRLLRDLTPAVRDVGRAATNATQLTESVHLDMQRLDAALQDVTESWSDATGRLHQAFVPTLGRLAVVTSAWRLARRGRALYRRFLG